MMDQLSHSLTAAAISTFEELGFLFADLDPNDEQRAAPLVAGMQVDFDGPRTGRVELRVSADLLPAIAANMLGADDAPEPALQQDALGELTNVICGNIVPSIGGPAAVFRLSPPIPVDAEAPFFLTLTDTLELGVDGGRAEVRLYLMPAEG